MVLDFISSTDTKLHQSQCKELALIKQSYGLSCIRHLPLTQCAFKEARIKFFDTYDKLIPCYDIKPVEKITDAVYKKINPMLLNHLLHLIMDHNLAGYITVKNNTVLTYKDMAHTNTYGLICGLQFSAFAFQYYGLVLDLLILGLQQANKMAGLPQMPNNFLQYHNSATKACHPIWLYSSIPECQP
ncbi:RNA recognition motif of the spliceosomal PrP8-domain-containing protein [Scleroderma yunnanense]